MLEELVGLQGTKAILFLLVCSVLPRCWAREACISLGEIGLAQIFQMKDVSLGCVLA